MKVIIITEGIKGTGYGHLTRCLSICQAFEEKGIKPLFIAHTDEDGARFLQGVNLITLNYLERHDEMLTLCNDSDIAIIDSYLAPPEIYESVTAACRKTLFIDDFMRLDYPAGIILNESIGAEKLPYSRNDQHDYLLGLSYMPLRQPFWDVQPGHSKRNIEHVLISFGGQDIREINLTLLPILSNKFKEITFDVIPGTPVYGMEKINYLQQKSNIMFHQYLSAEEMRNIILSSDAAIVAAGQTLCELARIGIPTIAIGVAENQRHNLLGWMEQGFLDEMLWFDQVNLADRVQAKLNEFIMLQGSRKIKSFNDGQGSRRIVEYLIKKSHSQRVTEMN